MRLRTAGVAAVSGVGVVALGVLLAAWPATVVLVALFAVGLLLAWRAPPLAILLGLLMLGFEGSIKVLLGLEETPLPGGHRAAGAAAIDLVLFAGVLSVLVRDRGRTPLALWRRLGRAERVALGCFVAWLLVSVPQVAQGPRIEQGVAGLRLFQAYVLVGAAAVVVLSVRWFAQRAVGALLSLGLAVGLYASVRVLVGAAPAEIAHATDTDATTFYGTKVRAVGSFSGAVGLDSFLVPLALFALVVGLLVPRHRLLAWTLAALSVAPIGASYARAPLLAIAVALASMLVVHLSTPAAPGRRRLAIVAGAAVALAATYVAIYLASRGTPLLRERAHGILHPFGDTSMRERFNGWSHALDRVADRPLGHGVGTQGSSAGRYGLAARTSDNSFLKVLIDQGVLAGVAFLGGLVGVIVAIARRLRRVEGDARAVGLAALTGFVGFLGLCLLGEAVEQPGKAIAWALLGFALVLAVAPPPAPAGGEWIPSWSLAAVRQRLAGAARPAWIAVAVVLAVVPFAITLGRAPGFEAAAELVPRAVGPYRVASDPTLYSRFLRDNEGRVNVGRGVRSVATPDPAHIIRLTRAPRGRLRLSARLESPGRARHFVARVAYYLVLRARDRLAATAFADVDRLEHRLKTHLPRAERRADRGRLWQAQFVALVRVPPLSVGRGLGVTDRRWGDRLLRAIPGFDSPRPEPVWAALGGVAVALALLAALLIVDCSLMGAIATVSEQ